MTTAITLAPRPSTVIDLYRAPLATLHHTMVDGAAPPFEDLVGWEFNGTNIGFFPGIMGIRKFRKGFYQGPARAVVESPAPYIQGYNIPVRQNGVGHPHMAKPSDEHPKRFGFYRVFAASKSTRFHRYPQSLLLHYGMGANGLDPAGLLRDYLVQVHSGSSDLLLGYACFALGPFTLPGGFFILERAREHTFVGTPTRTAGQLGAGA